MVDQCKVIDCNIGLLEICCAGITRQKNGSLQLIAPSAHAVSPFIIIHRGVHLFQPSEVLNFVVLAVDLYSKFGQITSQRPQPRHLLSSATAARVYPLAFISWLMTRASRGQNSVTITTTFTFIFVNKDLSSFVALNSASKGLTP